MAFTALRFIFLKFLTTSLDNPAKYVYNQTQVIQINTTKTVKRRVNAANHDRESRLLERDMDFLVEHGLGVAHRPGFPIGCDGFARYCDEVYADFLPYF